MQLSHLKAMILPLILPLGACVAVGDHMAVTGTPLQEVITLLQDMLQKGRQSKQNEESQYATYKGWCDQTVEETKGAIDDSASTIETLEADIQMASETAKQLQKEVLMHTKDIETLEADKSTATADHAKRKTHYTATHQDYSESIDALQRAISTLQAHQDQVTLLQTMNETRAELSKVSPELAVVLDQNRQSPTGYGYEFQSGSVIDTLEGLLTDFRSKLAELEEEHHNATTAHDDLIEDLDAQIDHATAAQSNKTADIDTQMAAKSDKEVALESTKSTKAADESYLSETSKTCKSKAADYAERERLRAEEIKTIEEALDILEQEVAGHASTYLPSMVQTTSTRTRNLGAAFASLRAALFNDGSGGNVAKKVHEYLLEKAQRLNSQALTNLVAQIQDDDPFAEVKQMIQDLIVRLQEEASKEADHKSWCDTELALNEKTRSAKSASVEQLNADIDELEASIAKLTDEIATLHGLMTDLENTTADATAIRTVEKAQNEQTIKDAKEAKESVGRALVLLREFYATAASATAFTQESRAAPAIFDSPYNGMQSEKTSVIGLLEVLNTDFARLERNTMSEESLAAQEYSTLMKLSHEDMTAKQTAMEKKTMDRQKKQQTVVVTNEDLSDAEKALQAAEDYYETLKPTCIEAGVSYDERAAKREEELASLREALALLGNATLGNATAM